jgi:uncharacterized protein (DUF305 family)
MGQSCESSDADHDHLSRQAALAHNASAIEQTFIAQNDAAMCKMMTDMAIRPSGDIDRDFVAMMVPHHQGAIDMAMAVLRYGRNEQIRRMAQEIIVTQQQEIAAMRLAIGDPHPSATGPQTHLILRGRGEPVPEMRGEHCSASKQETHR